MLLMTERDAAVAAQQVIVSATADAIAETEAATKRHRDSKAALLALLALAAMRLKGRFQDTVMAGRRAARIASHARLQLELESAAEELRQLPPGALAQKWQDAEDREHAALVADSYSTAWRAALVAALLLWLREPDTSLSARLRDAARSQDSKAARIVVTEVAAAFGDEHADASGAWVKGGGSALLPAHPYRSPPQGTPLPVPADREAPAPLAPTARTIITPAEAAAGAFTSPAGTTILGLLVRRWDAKLDRACPRCRRLDGTIAIVGGSFEGGLLPGRVHPHCRCTETVIPLTAKLMAFQRARATMGDAYQVTSEDVRQVRRMVRKAA